MNSILIIDDDPAFLDSLRRMLRNHQEVWSLKFAKSVNEALTIIKDHDIELIISDIFMPEKSGMDLLAHLKKEETEKKIPIILITGRLEQDLKLKALELGATELLSKPFDKAELIFRIKNCLRLKNYQDQIIKQNLILEEEIKYRKRCSLLSAKVNSALVEEEKLSDLLQKSCQSMVDCLEAAFARIWLFQDEKSRLKLAASAGMYTHIDGKHQYIPVGKFKIGLIAENRHPHFTNKVIGDPNVSDQEWAIKEKMVGFAGYPLVVKGRLVGVIAMFSKNELKDSILETLASIADGIALGIVKKKSDDQAHFYSFYDSLTRLPNRKFFNVLIGKMISYSNRYLKRFALLIIDIDDFNRINESLGHAAGDSCLKTIADRLLNALRNSDSVVRLSGEETPMARLGGDEFAILLQETSDIQQLNSVLNRILKALSEPILTQGRELPLSVSIGVSVYPDDGNSISDLFKNAETALYQAKRKGKSHFVFYSEVMNEASLEMLDLEISLRNAIDKKALQLYYQPKVNVITNELIGAEALSRWTNTNGDDISPAKFIPLAEKTGMIVPISDWVLQTTCQDNISWQSTGLAKIPIAVNISGLEFGQKDFIKKTTEITQSCDLSTKYLELEITETTIMKSPEKAIQNLKELKNNGFKISLDDFGTGYSSLAYLQKLPIDQVKIDRSFIKNILCNPNDAVMVKSIISMAHNLGLSVVAEGVEDKGQLEFLKQLKCDTVQGYLFSRPVPASKFKKFLKKGYKFSV